MKIRVDSRREIRIPFLPQLDFIEREGRLVVVDGLYAALRVGVEPLRPHHEPGPSRLGVEDFGAGQVADLPPIHRPSLIPSDEDRCAGSPVRGNPVNRFSSCYFLLRSRKNGGIKKYILDFGSWYKAGL